MESIVMVIGSTVIWNLISSDYQDKAFREEKNEITSFELQIVRTFFN
jgi:hypothetical protein